PGIASPGTIVHTLGFGNADQATLESIKTTPGYIHVTDTFDPLNNELDINNAISEIAAESHSSMLARVRIELPPVERSAGEDRPGTPDDLEEIAALTTEELDARSDIVDVPVHVNEGVTRVTFVANQRSVDSIFLYVLDPAGQPVVPMSGNFASGRGHATYSLAPTMPGTWRMRIRRLAGDRHDPAPVVLFAFAEHPTLTTSVIGANRLYRVDQSVELHAYAQNP
ncbi:MAG: hypothetical protein GY704_05690, partial [Phycisphaeraceae bacterium]|nr:hypothetical protein [Phycisphaeraceae bacterium]